MQSLSTVHTNTLYRLQQQMLEFDFDIRYKEGSTNIVADTLSQNTVISLADKSGTLHLVQRADFSAEVSESIPSGGIVSSGKEDRLARRLCF